MKSNIELSNSISFHEIVIREKDSSQVKYEVKKNHKYKQEYQAHQQLHVPIGQLIKSFVYAGVDGVTNMLIVLLSGFSSGTEAKVILAMCISFCIGDGIVMGLGDYLSARAEMDYIKSQENRENYEVDQLLDCQKKQIIKIYSQKAYQLKDTQKIAQLYSTNKKAFVNIMMLQELGLASVNDPILAIKCGIVTFCSFLIFGILPAIPYIVTAGIMKENTHPWIPSICIGSVELFSLGLIKATVIGLNKVKAGIQILLIGLIATAIGFGIGFGFKS